MATVFEILRKTRKDNCRECGYLTCMAFAAAVHTGAARMSACPFIETGTGDDHNQNNNRSLTESETALVKTLRSKVKDIDLAACAKALGAEPIPGEYGQELELEYLNKKIRILPDKITAADGQELETRDQILLYNYLFFSGSGRLSGRWTGLESFPNSISKVVTLKRYVEERLAEAFGSRPEKLERRCRDVGGRRVEPCHADVCMQIPVLPRVPVQIHFWDQDEEDGFPAKVKVLFDENALDFLDIESLIFAAERMAETITGP